MSSSSASSGRPPAKRKEIVTCPLTRHTATVDVPPVISSEQRSDSPDSRDRRHGYDLQLTRYDDRGWRATFYTTGMEHSPRSATGTGWERTPWHATQRVGGRRWTVQAANNSHLLDSRHPSQPNR